MSQLFDSLRRGGSPKPPHALRSGQGDAVLATLGYAPVSRRPGTSAALVALALLAGIVGQGFTFGFLTLAGGDPARDCSCSDSDRTAGGVCRYRRDDISDSAWSRRPNCIRLAVGHGADRRAVSLVIADRPGETWPSSH